MLFYNILKEYLQYAKLIIEKILRIKKFFFFSKLTTKKFFIKDIENKFS